MGHHDTNLLGTGGGYFVEPLSVAPSPHNPPTDQYGPKREKKEKKTWLDSDGSTHGESA